MADALKGFFQPLLSLKRAYFNPHEHFGRANICRFAIGTYVGIYLLFKWNKEKKAKSLAIEQQRQKKNIAQDALARAGLA